MAEAFVTSVASNLVSKLGEHLFAPIRRQFGYVLCYKCYIEDLENGVKEVEHARKRVQSSVDEAMYDGKLIHADVEDWLESVEKKAKEAENLLKHGASAKNDCFRGWLPNPMVRHPIGKKVKKMTQVIQELHEKSQNNNFLKVYYENPPIGIVTAITPTARSVDNKQDVLESRAKITEEVIKAIVDDKVCVLGVWGVGGVGKSKLLEEVERRVKHEKMFDEVVMANVSRNLDLKRIQGEIAYALGLKLMNEETTRGRADLLCKRIERDHNKSILIILDNLWKKLDLKEVGIPCGDNNKVKCCKLLITSRYRDVLRNDMSSDREVQLNKLEHGEARRLFERTLGDRVGDRVNHLEFIDGVVKNCGGLPLLIVSLAKRLKHGDLAAWRTASNNIDASDVKSLVELTYNDLKDERIKSLFLICALNSGRICLRDSFMYCMGLGLFEKFSNTIENARDRLIVDLHSLQDSSLLLDSGDMEWFRMHDIFVDAAISISSTEWNALVGRKDFGFKEWSNDKLRKCTAIFILFVDIDELPEKLDCPNLRMLVLGEHNPSLKVPELFFESMTELQVLDFTGLFFTSLPSSIEFLENLKSLYLFKCHLKDVTVLGKLKGLQFLDLGGSTIALLPEEIGELTKLRLLNLTSCTKLKVIKPGVLGSLVNLEELYMEDGFDQWEAEDEAPRSNASLAELKNMKKLSTLYIAIPHYTKLSRDLPFGKLNKHKIHIGYVWDWWGEYRESRTLKLKLDSSNLFIEEWMLSCLQKTQDLHLDGLRHGVDSIRDLCIEGFPELKHLHIQNSPSLQNVVYSIGNVKCTTFTGLESLFLKNLNNLKKICHGCLALESFSKLKILKVDNCGEIKHLFPLSIKRTILQLEEIEISRCHLMQQIVADAEADTDGDEIYDDAKVKLCNLRRLTLRNLPEMMSFCKTADHSIDFFNGQQVSLPRLESLTLCKLPKMKEIWNSQFPLDVGTLKFLKVEDCAFLMSIFPSNLVIKLQDLEAITIERCQFIRKVFDLEGPTTSGDVKILRQLTTLTLSDLPRLEHIWNKNPRIALCFPKLRVLKVQGCENMRFIFSSSMAKALQQIKEIKIARCKLLEKIMDVQEEESKKATSLYTLKFPLLSSLSLEELPNLRTFSHGTHYIQCPTLTRLRISGCPKMMTFSSFEGKQHMITANTGLQQAFGGVNSSLSLPILFDQNVLLPRLEELTVVSCGLMKIWHNELSEESFCKLASITIQNCENLSYIFPSNIIEVFQSLKRIEVINCTSLESLMERVAVNTKKRPKSLVFSNLNKVKLWDLPRLDALVTSSSQATLSLPSLTTINLRNCHNLRYLFTYDTSGTLVKLEMLDVSDCNKMQEVVAMEESQEQKLKAVKFSCLRTLKLWSLKSLISFSSGSCAFEFPSLTNLSILECIELKAFILRLPMPRVETTNEGTPGSDESPPSLFDEKVLLPRLEELTVMSCGLMKIWHNELSEESFCKLASITIQNCGNLSHIFPSNIIEAFQSLKMIEVVNCPSLEFLMEHVAVNTKKRPKCPIFLNLKEVKLWDLPRLDALVTSSSQATLSLPNLTTVSLRNCHSLRYLFTYDTFGTLNKLEKLDVSDCNKMQEVVAMEESEERKLKAMKFSCLQTLKLCSLKSLISFSSGNCAYEFPSLKNLSILECTELKAFILRWSTPSVETVNEESVSFDESPHSLFDEKALFSSLEELTLMSLCGLMKIWHNELSEEAFPKLAFIKVGDCENLSHIFPSTSIERLRSLKRIEVVNCTSLEAFIKMVAVNAKKRPKSLVFSFLEIVKLRDLPMLNAFVTSSSQATLSLPSLTTISLHRCPSLRYLFANDTSRTLDKLEMLDVSYCNKMQEVVAIEENEEQKLKAVKFSHLCTLKLYSLKSLISFSSGSCAYEFPSLRNLSILKCTELKAFILWLPAPRVETMNEGSFGSNESPHSLFNKKVVFPNLEELHLTAIQSRVLWENEMANESICELKVLEVKQCPNLLNVIPSFTWKRLLQSMKSLIVEECPCVRNLFTMSMAKSLVQLEYLGLGGCGEMEYIVAREEEKLQESPDIIVIPQLVTLYLHKMIKLRSFCHGKHISEWPSLKEFTVEDCKAVEVILGDASCRRLQGSIPMQQPLLLVEKVEFPSMESMKISHMDNMEKIWLDELPSNAFSKLKKLIVEYCEKLSSIFSSDSILTRFQNLEKLKVTDCDSLEVVFQMQELNMSGSHSTSTFQLRKLKLKRLQKLKHVWSGPPCGTFTFECLRCLKAKNCESLQSLFPVSIAKSMTQLKELLIQDCGLEEIIAVEGEVGMSVGDLFFPKLTDLRLLELPELRRFYRNSHALTWPLLKKLRARHCGKMRLFSVGTTTGQNQPTLFPFEEVIRNLEGLTLTSEDVMMMMKQHHVFRSLTELELACYHDGNVAFPSNFLLHRFPDLGELSLSCSFFEEIFPEDACGHGGATPYRELTDMETPLKALKNLERLELNKLCKLQRVWKDGSLMAEILKQIETLVVSECSSLSIVLPSPTAFQTLTKLEVKDCAGLVHMGTCSAVTSLVHLTSLILRDCGAMEDVVTDDGNGTEDISFPELEELILDGLPSLESFSPSNCTFIFPWLERIVVMKCPKMNIFCRGVLRTPDLDEVLLSEEDDEGRWVGDLNTTIQTLSA